MRIGIIAEGRADRAVVENVLSGVTGLDRTDFIALRPSDLYDETDKAVMNPAAFGSWTLVRQECKTRELIDPFLLTDDHAFIVIQIDSAEAHLYGIEYRRQKSAESYEELRRLIVDQINAWLSIDLSTNILYAVAVEEIDAWVLALFENGPTSRYLNVKRHLGRFLNRKGIDSTSSYKNYVALTKEFTKSRTFDKLRVHERNESLKAFYEEVMKKIVPLLSA